MPFDLGFSCLAYFGWYVMISWKLDDWEILIDAILEC